MSRRLQSWAVCEHALVLLKACLNGARPASDHPALPATAAELGADAARVRAVGADAVHVHVHVKDVHGVDTLDGDRVAEVVAAVRSGRTGPADRPHDRSMGRP